MTEVPLWIREIENRSPRLPVLVVDGEDDVPLIEHFRRYAPIAREYIP